MCNNNQSHCNPQLHDNLLDYSNEEVWKSDPNAIIVDPNKNVLYTVKDGLTDFCCGSMDEVYDRITNFKAYSTIKNLLENNNNAYYGSGNFRVLVFLNIKNMEKFLNDHKDLFEIFEKMCIIHKGEDNISFAFKEDAPRWLTTYISNISAEIKMRDPEYQTMLTDIIFNLNNSCNSAFPESYK